jgi:hypothetical protein
MMTQLWRNLGDWQDLRERVDIDARCAIQIRNAAILNDDRKSIAMNEAVLAALRAAGFVETADELERAVL